VRRLALILVCLTVVVGLRARPAQAFDPIGTLCGVASLASGLLGKACDLASNGGRILSTGKQILGGHIGSAVKTALGASKSLGSGVKAALSLAAIGAWVLGGARFALHETAKVISETTTPQLGTSWFSATYWRVAGIAALLTLPFLFAAVVQALIHSDLALLLRTVLGYLPLAMLAVGIAAPVTILLLSASDELSRLVSSAAGYPGSGALKLGFLAGGLSGLAGSAFLIFFLGLLTVAGATALWLEMLMREAAVYVVVLMLPLAFSALVWPARRVWAVRAVELLVALILSKFAIVAVLSLGGAALDQVGHSITAPIAGLVLVMMGAFAPWALLRLIPLSELGAGALESMRGHGTTAFGRGDRHFSDALTADEWATATTAQMRRGAEETAPGPQDSRAPLPDQMRDGTGETDDASGLDGPEPTVESSGEPGPETAMETGLDPEGLGAEPPRGAGSGPPGGRPAQEGAGDRVPGLPEMWQADDLTWTPLVLGAEGGLPPQVWPPEGGDEQAGLPDPESARPSDPPALDPAPDSPPLPEGQPATDGPSLPDRQPATDGPSLPEASPATGPPPPPSVDQT
jgi:hypothetical protein